MADAVTQLGVPITIAGRGRAPGGPDPRRAFYQAKRTLIIAVKRSLRFDRCPPSADYQFPLVTGCPGLCHYCYLHASPGVSPAVRAYANIEQILNTVARTAAGREMTTFEAASTSDPVAVEHITKSLARTINWFGQSPHVRLRFVTKFSGVEPLLSLDHNGHTTVRFSVNIPELIRRYEAGTEDLDRRVAAATRVAAAEYPVGFMIAPIFPVDNWQTKYGELVDRLALGWKHPAPDFELITHRFTRRGAKLIAERFSTDLDFGEQQREMKRGRYGHVKFVFPSGLMAEIESVLRSAIARRFPGSRVLYFT